MNKKDLPVMYSSVFWCLLSCYCFFFFLWGRGREGLYCILNHYSKAGHFDLAGYWTSHNKNAIFSAKIQFTAMFFSTQEENLLFLSGSSAQKSLIISPSNWAICAWLQGKSGFPPVPVDIVVPTISFAFEIWNHARLTISVYMYMMGARA